jgi:hypothetical protein
MAGLGNRAGDDVEIEHGDLLMERGRPGEDEGSGVERG